MAELFNLISQQFRIPIWLVLIILAWVVVWKLMALWKSARKKHIVWFIVLAVVNTISILPILYIYVFSKLGEKKQRPRKKVVKRKASKKKK